MNALKIDNTKRSCFSQCPKKYYWQFIKHLKPLKGSTALRFGSTYHAFQEEYRRQRLLGADLQYCKGSATLKAMEVWTQESECGQLFEHDYRTYLQCSDTFYQYLDFYGETDFKPLMVEHVFSVPFAAWGHYEVMFEGKIDLIGSLDDDVLSVVDDKTSGYTAYHVFAEKRAQLIGYCWVANKLHPEFKVNQAYINLALVKQSGKVGNKVVTAEFNRMPYLYSDNDMADWHYMMQGECKQICEAHDKNNFYPIFEACQTKYGACDYVTLCGMSNPDEAYIKANFIEKKWEVCV